MNKRIQKKKHLGKFREYGVSVEAEYIGSDNKELVNKWFDDYIHFIESNNWVMGGGFCDHTIACNNYDWVTKQNKKYINLTQADAIKIRKHLEAQPWCNKIVKCEVVDLWYGWKDD